MWREWSDANIIHGSKVLNDLIEPWYNTHRVVCADSYFASVSTAKELMLIGMRFIGVVKTAFKKFSIAYLQALEFFKRVEWKGLRNATTLLYVFVWVACNRRYFITNTSSLSHRTPYTRV